MAKKSGTKKTAAKKKAAKKKAAKKNTPAAPTKKAAQKRTRKSSKGGFGVFTVAVNGITDDTPNLFPDQMVLTRVASDLKDTADCSRWIKENAAEYDGQELAIVQIKKTVTVKLTQTTKVTLE